MQLTAQFDTELEDIFFRYGDTLCSLYVSIYKCACSSTIYVN